MPKAFQQLWSDEKLLNVAEQIVGPDIAGHPVWNLRTKVLTVTFSAGVTLFQHASYLQNVKRVVPTTKMQNMHLFINILRILFIMYVDVSCIPT